MHREKYSNMNCVEWWIPAKRCRISIVRYMNVDVKQEVRGDPRSGGTPNPQFNPWLHNLRSVGVYDGIANQTSSFVTY